MKIINLGPEYDWKEITVGSGADLSGIDLSGAWDGEVIRGLESTEELTKQLSDGTKLQDGAAAVLGGLVGVGGVLHNTFVGPFSGLDEEFTDLSGANLSGSNLSGLTLKKVNLRGANLSQANFSGAQLVDVDLTEANLSNANFSKTKISSDVSALNKKIKQTLKLSKKALKLSKKDTTPAQKGHIEHQRKTKMAFEEAKLAHTGLEKFISNFSISTSLVRANFSGADFEGSVIIDVDMSGLDLTKATLKSVEFGTNKDIKSLGDKILGSLILTNAKGYGVDLSDSNLTGLDLKGCEFSDADLSRAKLTIAN